jgi:hypothetical protein
MDGHIDEDDDEELSDNSGNEGSTWSKTVMRRMILRVGSSCKVRNWKLSDYIG